MSERFLGEIRIFGGNYAPQGWAFCDGQFLAIANYNALFSLLGTTYGGDGRSTFAVPDLRGRLAIHQGQGPGLTNRQIGARFGTERVTLTEAQLPRHNHPYQGSTKPATTTDPSGKVMANVGTGAVFYEAAATADALKPINDAAVEPAGSGDSHYNMMPYTVINYIIALTGTYPSRS